MGERYDVLLTVPDSGVFPLVAVAEGTSQQGIAVLRSGRGAMPMPDVKPMALGGKLLSKTSCTQPPPTRYPPQGQTGPT
jgi:FtsP/CotA-like multicopper oxidase with cupredoxin domain